MTKIHPLVDWLAKKLMASGFIEALFRHGLMEKLFMSPIFHPPVKIYKTADGRLPERMTDGAIGYDAWVRSVVSSKKDDMSQDTKYLRRTLYNFEGPHEADPHIKQVEENGKMVWAYVLEPGEQVTVGIGFVTSMPHLLKYWVAPRSGLSSRQGITISNAPGTVDPDYRGEAGANVRNQGTEAFPLTKNTRIVQVTFSWVALPAFQVVERYEELDSTKRGAGGFGHTGFTGEKVAA
jgi:dUTP pyrophosphatase